MIRAGKKEGQHFRIREGLERAQSQVRWRSRPLFAVVLCLPCHTVLMRACGRARC